MAEQVLILAVDVAADVDGRLQLQEHGLLQEDVTRLLTQLTDVGLRQLHLERKGEEVR